MKQLKSHYSTSFYKLKGHINNIFAHKGKLSTKLSCLNDSVKSCLQVINRNFF